MALKFLSNVSNEGIFYTTGNIVASLSPAVEASLIARGLAEQTDEAPTHGTAVASATGDALPLAAPAEPVADGFPQHSAPAPEDVAPAAPEPEQPQAPAAPEAPAEPVKHGFFGLGGTKPQPGQPAPEDVTATAEQVQ